MRIKLSKAALFTVFLITILALIFAKRKAAKKIFQKAKEADNEVEPDSTWRLPIISLIEQVEEGLSGSVKLGFFESLDEPDANDFNPIKHGHPENHNHKPHQNATNKDKKNFSNNNKSDKNIKNGRVVHVHMPKDIKEKVDKHQELKKKNEAPTHDDRVKVLIFARWRSGSTFAGELFNRNENAFYIFEPLYTRGLVPHGVTYEQMVSKKSKDKEILPKFHQVLNDFYTNCTVPRDSIRRFNRFNEHTDNLQFKGYSEEKIRFELEKACEKFDEVCQTYDIRASKTIRLKSLNHLPDSLKKRHFKNNLKVIFLTRDPRGIAKSRFTRSRYWNYPKDLPKLDKICDTYERFLRERSLADLKVKDPQRFARESTIKYFKDDKKTWDNDVLVVRYEDMSFQPIKIAEKIYKFIGREIPNSLIKRLNQTTVNSATTSMAWSRKLEWDAVDRIQKNCELTFRHFGYVKVKDEEEYNLGRNNLTKGWVENPGCDTCNW